MENFFSEDDLLDILEELDEMDSESDISIASEDEEIAASNRRYEEIIKKYKM
jgi:hypothetical protein